MTQDKRTKIETQLNSRAKELLCWEGYRWRINIQMDLILDRKLYTELVTLVSWDYHSPVIISSINERPGDGQRHLRFSFSLTMIAFCFLFNSTTRKHGVLETIHTFISLQAVWRQRKEAWHRMTSYGMILLIKSIFILVCVEHGARVENRTEIHTLIHMQKYMGYWNESMGFSMGATIMSCQYYYHHFYY